MSFEAVPCRFRSSQGPNGETEYIGLLIRPAGEAANSTPQPAIAPPAAVRGGNGAAPAVAPVRVLAAGTPITVSGDNAPRYLVPANVSVTPIPIGSTWSTPVARPLGPPATVPSTFTTPPSNIASPCSQQPRSLSVCSSSPMTASSPMSPPPVTQILQQNGSRQREQAGSRASVWQSSNDSSTTPDSGIQSVPGSPPSHHRDSPPTIEACTSVCEDRPEEEDYADMPRLIPIDQEEDFCLPGPSGLREEHSTTGSECETTAPMALSITPLMDNARAAEQLIQLDSEKALLIAREIQKRMGASETPTPPAPPKRRAPKREPVEKVKRRKPSVVQEVKKKEEAKKKKVEEEPIVKEEVKEPEVLTPKDSRKMYRAAMKKRMEEQLNKFLEKTIESIQELHIGERERHGRKTIKGKSKTFNFDWEALKRKRRRDEEKVQPFTKTLADYKITKVELKKTEKISLRKKTDRKRKITETHVKEEDTPETSRPSRASLRTPQKRRQFDGSAEMSERKVDLEYEEIPRSVCIEDLPGWKVPTIQCGCSRGACSSDAECINRALFVQCRPNCQAPLCINKKFWKEEAVRLLSASGPKSKKSLKTKTTRRAGEFLGEYAGEVISYAEAVKRNDEYLEKDEASRILCLSPGLFVDATRKGNLCRYVRHSCRPNSRLEVWSINGNLRAGLFSLVDLASNTEVTISMSGLLPVSRNCISCLENDSKCCKIIKRSRNAYLSSSESMSTEEGQYVKEEHVFLPRNRRHTIERAKRQFVPRRSDVPNHLQESLEKILDGLQLRIRRVDGSIPYKAVSSLNAVQKAVRLCDQQLFQSTMEQLLDKLDDDDFDRVYAALLAHYLPSEVKDKKKDVRHGREVDTSYLDLLSPVGSYNPDEAWPRGAANKRADAVRCECGSLEEDGKMLQCDACNYWLHTDCVGNIDENTKYYQCRLCSGEIAGGIPSTDVPLAKQPDLRLEGCVYYKALMNNRNIQVRQYETVYLEKVETDEHKKILKKLTEVNEKSKKRKSGEKLKTPSPPPPARTLKPPGQRKDTRIFRVERLFVSPGGHRFVFGFYYARPHETICDPQRLFHRNEVFGTPFYDTLPLDAVVGRCVVLDPDVWIKGRPTVPQFKEEDVLLCDYQIDKTQRSFEKIPARYRFPMNTQPYVFEKFTTPKPLTRDFTPFLAGERSTSRNSGRLSRADGSKTNFHAKQLATQRLESIVSRLSVAQETTS